MKLIVLRPSSSFPSHHSLLGTPLIETVSKYRLRNPPKAAVAGVGVAVAGASKVQWGWNKGKG